MPNRRVFELIVLTSLLMWPARATVHAWGQKQLVERQPGDVLYGVGEVLVTIT